MIAKTQKTFLFTIGSNDGRVTEEDLMNEALAMETHCNATSPNLRVHIEELSEKVIEALKKEEKFEYPRKWFHEMGLSFEVEVLEHTQDPDRETYKLRATGETRNNDGLIANIKEGTVFTVWRDPEYAAYSGWSIRDD